MFISIDYILFRLSSRTLVRQRVERLPG